MKPITLTNDGWNQSTPETPIYVSCTLSESGKYETKPCSSFTGIYYTTHGRMTIWRQTPDQEIDDVEADDYGTLLRFNKDRVLRGKF